MSGSDQAAAKPCLRVKSRASSGHRGSLEISGTITVCLVNAAAPQEALSGPIRQGVMAALNVVGTRGPAHGDSHSPFIKQTIEVTGGACASMAAHKSFRTSERLAPLAIISSVRFSAVSRDSACDAVGGFGAYFDSDPAGRAMLGVSSNRTSWCCSSWDSGELFILIGRCA